jgi:hypothetical protein
MSKTAKLLPIDGTETVPFLAVSAISTKGHYFTLWVTCFDHPMRRMGGVIESSTMENDRFFRKGAKYTAVPFSNEWRKLAILDKPRRRNRHA